MTTIDTSTEAVERLLEDVTPGPWDVPGQPDKICAEGYTRNGAAKVIATASCPSWMQGNECAANARFIAAARDLVPALLKERDEARARVMALEEITDPDFIWGALDNVHDMDVTLDDYAKAVSRAQRAALAASQPADPVTNAGCRHRSIEGGPQMTRPADEELDALVGSLHRAANNLRHEGFIVDAASCDAGGSVLTALRAQLAEARTELVRRVDMHECAMAERDDSTLYSDEQKARADRAEEEVRRLKAAIFGSENYAQDLKCGNFVEMAETLHAAQKGGLERADRAEAALAAQVTVKPPCSHINMDAQGVCWDCGYDARATPAKIKGADHE